MLEWKMTSFDANLLQLLENNATTNVYRSFGSATCSVIKDPSTLRQDPPPHPRAVVYTTQADLKKLLHAFPIVPQVRTFTGPKLPSQEAGFDWSAPLLPPTGSLHGVRHILLGRAVEARLNMKVDDQEVRVWQWILRQRSAGGEYMAGLHASTNGLALSWLTQTEEEARADSRRGPGLGNVLDVLDYGVLDDIFEKAISRYTERRAQKKIEAQYPGYTYALGLAETINQQVAKDAIGVSFLLDGRAVISSSISDVDETTTRIVQVALGNAWGKQVLFAFICDFERYDQTMESVGERVGKFSAVVKSRMIPASSAAAAAPLQARLEKASDPDGRFVSVGGAIDVGVEARSIRPVVDWYPIRPLPDPDDRVTPHRGC